MSSPTLQEVFDAARGYLHDTQVSGGEVWTNSALQVHFAEPYRRMFSILMGQSKRVQRTAYVNLPANTSVLIPRGYNITDFDEPEMIEEKPALTPLTITSTSTTTPVTATITAHGLGSAGTMVQGVIGGVAGSSAPWGRWYVTVVDANTVSLNGSVSDGASGTGGSFTAYNPLQFQEVLPIDLAAGGLDGIPTQYLGVYLWENNQLQFCGATGVQQLRITYWASGAPPTNPSTQINIDNCLDFLACGTAANAARANGWFSLSTQLKTNAFGASQDSDMPGGLLGEFLRIQVMTQQRGPQRRRLPFRDKRDRFGGTYLLG